MHSHTHFHYTFPVEKKRYSSSTQLNSNLVNNDSVEYCKEGKQAMQWINCESPGLNSDDFAEQGDARPSQHAEVRQEEEETDAETGQNDLSLAWWPMISWDCYLQQESEEEARPRAKGEEEE